MITLEKLINGVWVEIQVSREDYDKAKALAELNTDNEDEQEEYINDYFEDEFEDEFEYMTRQDEQMQEYYDELKSWFDKRTGV